jgi:hypothetical protein
MNELEPEDAHAAFLVLPNAPNVYVIGEEPSFETFRAAMMFVLAPAAAILYALGAMRLKRTA